MSQEQCEEISNTPYWGRYTFAAGVLVFVIGQISALFSVILISHKLTAEVFGQLSSGLVIQNYVVLVGTLGLRTIIVRDLARNPDQLGAIWGSFWSIIAPIGAIVTVIGYLMGGWIYSRSSDEALMSLWLTIGAWFSMLSVVPLLDGMNRQSLSMAIGATIEIVFLLGIATSIIPMNISALGGAFALKWGSVSLLQSIALSMTTKSVKLTVNKIHLQKWVRTAPPLLMSSLIINIPILGTVLFVRFFLGEKESGVAGLGAQLANGLLLLGGVGIRFIQPMWRDKAAILKSSNRMILTFIGLSWGFMWISVSVLAAMIIYYWLPKAYQQHLIAIEILIGAGAIGILARILWIVLLAMERETAVWRGYFWGSLAFIVLCFILTPMLGVCGASVAAISGNILTSIILLYVVWAEIHN